uniref:Reverse transcriptase/retrotransposon-derived protein RNase H-like domain-containing protein n=1 Tax=Solanum lycopersicum TaxID=4081 RepID=A0A3Q7HKA4_SOLLC
MAQPMLSFGAIPWLTGKETVTESSPSSLSSHTTSPTTCLIALYSASAEDSDTDLMDRLSKACWFTELDLRARYWQEIKFLGHLVSKNQVRLDPKKVQAIVDWKAPRHVNDLRAAALTDLLKKDTKWVWSERCDEAFQNLKNAIASEPILKLPDFELPFEVHTDASDKVIGGILGRGQVKQLDVD